MEQLLVPTNSRVFISICKYFDFYSLFDDYIIISEGKGEDLSARGTWNSMGPICWITGLYGVYNHVHGEIWVYSMRGNPCRIPRTFIRPVFLERLKCILNFPFICWYGDSFRSRIDRWNIDPVEPYPDGGRILPNAIATIVKSTIFISSRSDTNQFSWNWYRIRNSVRYLYHEKFAWARSGGANESNSVWTARGYTRITASLNSNLSRN